MLSASHKSIYCMSCEATVRRTVRMGLLSGAHSHVRACQVMRAGASAQVALPLLSHFEHGTVRHARGPVETAMHQKTHARIPAATHGTGCLCRFAPLHCWHYARLGTSTVAVTADDLAGAFRRETCRETRVEAAYQPRCFLAPSSTENRTAVDLPSTFPLVRII
jgi:hypothetical protein